jgi:16S rRNA (cytidine1402-2'-O)-methyltransferase
LNRLQSDADQQRGEFVLLLAFKEMAVTEDSQLRHCLEVLLQELPVKQAAGLAAKLLGDSRNKAYQLALQIQNERS